MDSDYNFIAYARFCKQGQCLILINNNDHPITKEMTVWELGTPRTGKMQTIFQSDAAGYRLQGQDYEMTMGKITIELPATSATILKYRRDFPEE